MSPLQSSATTKQQVMQLVNNQQFKAARSLGQKLCKRYPADAEAWFLLGAIHGQLKDFQEAESCCKRAIRLQPEHAGLHYNLAIALLNQGKVNDATDCYVKTLELKPDFIPAYSELATIYIQSLYFEKALTLLEAAVRYLPDDTDLHLKLGLVYYNLGRAEDGLRAYHHVLTLEPQHVEATYGIGRIHRFQGSLTEAKVYFEKVISLKPDHAEALAVLGGTMKDQGRVDEGLVFFRKAQAIQPNRADIHSSLLLNLNYTPATNPEEIFLEHCRWGKLHSNPEYTISSPNNSCDAERPLRIGYVSPDFRAHSVAYFFEPLLLQHDRSSFECYCYADLRLHPADSTTARFEHHADHWRDITLMNDLEAADQVRADGIDILVDLAGHTAGNRLGLFACKPAPIQISYLGYPNTTGLPTMDYRITDFRSDPENETDPFYVESLIRLPQGFLCYQPPQDAPDPGQDSTSSSEYITFGSFNNLAKVTPDMINVWAELLNLVGDARLLLKNSSFRDEPTREYYYAMFLKVGVARERLSLMPGTASLKTHLAAYNTVDIALDTYPYNGTTTTCEALWMGVPVVTLRGATHVSRVGFSILSQVGLEDLSAASVESYLKIASGLAADLNKQRQFRKTLRKKLLSSPLCNAEKITRSIEASYRKVWKDWCIHRQTKQEQTGNR